MYVVPCALVQPVIPYLKHNLVEGDLEDLSRAAASLAMFSCLCLDHLAGSAEDGEEV